MFIFLSCTASLRVCGTCFYVHTLHIVLLLLLIPPQLQEERKKKKEEEEMARKAERAQKMAEFEKWKNPPTPNFVITKRSESTQPDDVSYWQGPPARHCVSHIHSMYKYITQAEYVVFFFCFTLVAMLGRESC